MEAESRISLEGSTSIVIDFFECSVNSILYQRGVYPCDEFDMVKKYGVDVFMTSNDEIKRYIGEITSQLRVWLSTNKISKLVLVIKSADTLETLERWQFDIHVNAKKTPLDSSSLSMPPPPPQSPGLRNLPSRSDKDVVKELRAIMRQITSSVSFLPELDDCTFNILVYTDEDIEVPTSWADSDPNLIQGGGEHVRLKSFSTSVHMIDTIVAYRVKDDF